MNSTNKTLYIPLYGKAYVSGKGIILHDPTAETIWEREGFKLKGKAKSRWLAYYMGMRASVFDEWTRTRLAEDGQTVIIHIGCGLDSRVKRVGADGGIWCDVDFPEVISERRRYYTEFDSYRMIAADVRDTDFVVSLPEAESAAVVMEGVSMYLREGEMRSLMTALGERYARVSLLADAYTELAAKASRYKNPVREVGVTEVYGTDDPETFSSGTGLSFVHEREMTPMRLINELDGAERAVFRLLYGGRLAKKLYRLYEYEKQT